MSNIEEDDHSTLIGGSTAERRIYCPGSRRAEAEVPKKIRDKSSSYADEGTALHSAMSFALDNGIVDPDELVGFACPETGILITQELADTALAPCFDFLDALEEECKDEGGIEYIVEKKVAFPGVDGAFGTADYIGKTAKRSIIIDWKFGQGEEVKVEYDHPEPHVNSQPMFYGTAAYACHPSMFGPGDDWPVDIYIGQPRLRDSDPVFGHAQVTVGDFKDFEIKVARAVLEGKKPDAPKVKGPWCRFAACKVVCPHFTGPLIETAALANITSKSVKLKGVDWEALLPDMLEAADTAEEVITKIREIAHSYLESGRTLEGWKLVAKRANRKWRDEEEAIRVLQEYGLKDKDYLTEPELKSPAQVETVVKKYGIDLSLKAGDEPNLVQQISSGTTLARADSRKADVSAAGATLKRLGERLAALAKPGK